ncbi:MAG: hypothetical protein KDD10_18505 [Phaeodactylibacter sp.]|nr:hypothetical protein [Phaeodactylibacter sp.]MCB9297051.1 hypothetical protein [Lewinellaceae bacterium]
MKSRTSKIIIAAALLALLAAGAYSVFQQDNVGQKAAAGTPAAGEAAQEPSEAAQPAGKLVVDAPFEHVEIAPKALLIQDPGQPSIHRLPSGTVLRVPANAFAGAGGAPVTTPVQLSFREFHSAAEIIASGIPMRVPNAEGGEEWLQTAGMYEINGTSEGQPVEIASGKFIEIDLSSQVGGDYDFWIFDKESGRWANQGTAAAAEKDEAALEAARTEVRELRRKTATPPVVPKATPEEEKLIFTDLDIRNCPELAGKQPLALTYAGDNEKEDPKNNQWIANPGIWRKKSLRPAGQKGLYELTLLGDEVYRIPVRLALQGKNLEQARREYEAALASYQADMALLRNAEALLAQQAAFRRTMRVSAFGIYNYDILWKRPDSVPLAADFEFDGLPETIKPYITVYLVTGDNRTVVGLPHGDWGKLRISPSADNKLIAVLPGDKVAVFSQSDFNREMEAIKEASGSRYVFDMKVESQPLGSVESLQQVLQRASS